MTTQAQRVAEACIYLEHSLNVVRHWHAITVGERQDLVIVEDGVEIFDPDGIHGAIGDDPGVVRVLTVIVLCPHGSENACQ